jgi:hypothetical protein
MLLLTIVQKSLQKKEYAGHWDQSVSYAEALATFKQNIQTLRESRHWNAKKELLYNIILATQCANESRISEALEAVTHWVNTGERNKILRTRKRADNEQRNVLIPGLITDTDRRRVSSLYPQMIETTVSRYKRKLKKPKDGKLYTEVEDVIPKMLIALKWYAREALSIRTHSLRYSGIGKLIKDGENILNIAKITKHKKADQLITYASQMAAEELQEKQASEFQ